MKIMNDCLTTLYLDDIENIDIFNLLDFLKNECKINISENLKDKLIKNFNFTEMSIIFSNTCDTISVFGLSKDAKRCLKAAIYNAKDVNMTLQKWESITLTNIGKCIVRYYKELQPEKNNISDLIKYIESKDLMEKNESKTI